MFKIYDEPDSPNKGAACLRYVEPDSPNEGYVGMFKIHDEADSPNEGSACLRYMANRNRHMRGRVQDTW